MSIRVGIDGRVFSGPLTGIGKYSYNFCKLLDTLYPEAEFIVFCKDTPSVNFFSERWVVVIDNKSFWGRFLKPVLWLKFRSPFLIRQFSLDHYIGLGTFFPIMRRKINRISILYDFNVDLFPQTMGLFHRMSHKLFFKCDLKSANHIVAISNGTEDRLKFLYNLKATIVVHPIVDKTFKSYSDEECICFKDKYNLPDKYFLAVSTLEPRKNIPLLIKTFVHMKQRGELTNEKLVLAGKRGWGDGEIYRLIMDNKNDIIFLGYVPDLDLPCIYHHAKLFIFPSLYEGFGIPVREAVLCGTQVVATDIPEIREAGGVGAYYITPNEEGITNAINFFKSSSYHQEKKIVTFCNDIEISKFNELFNIRK